MDIVQILEEVDNALGMNSETDLVEFKKATGGFPKKEVRKTLSAFGNTKGGIIVFGVKESDDKKLSVEGIDNTAYLQERMTNLSADEMNEVLRLEYYCEKLHGKDVLIIYVPECSSHLKPYYFKEAGLPNGAYVRDGNTDRRMTEEESKSYVRNAHIDDFDGHCAMAVDISSLSEDKIESFLRKSSEKIGRDFNADGSYEEILNNIGVIRDCEGIKRPTIAGYLIFSDELPQQKKQFERYVIRCVRYDGSGVHADILDKADISGTIDEQIDAMHLFVLRNIKKEAKIVGTKRVEKYEYPEKAIREIIANSVIHRDYRITETYTQVNVFENRIEITNPGNLPPGVTIENIKTAQVSRNKIIAARLNEMDYLEEYGRGIDIVFAEMNKWGLLPPILKNTSNSFKVILPGESFSELNERQLKMWEYFTGKLKVVRKELQDFFPDVSQPTISNDLSKLKEMGLIQQKGAGSSTYYEISL